MAADDTAQGRQLVVRVRVSERATARLELTRQGTRLVDRRGWVLPGLNTLRVAIPVSARKGMVDLALALADVAGHRLALHGGVLVPSLSRRDPCLGMTTCVLVEVGSSSGPAEGGTDGNGEVTSSPAGIDCRFDDGQPDGLSICRAYFRSLTRPTITLTLMLNPDPGSYVGECPQADSVAGRGCSVTHTLSSCGSDNCYTPNYALDFLLRRFSLTLTRNGFGSGRIVAQGSRTFPTWRRSIKCVTKSCTLGDIPYGTAFKVRAAANEGSIFLRWTGACAGRRSPCTLTMTQDTSVGATFVRPVSIRP